MEMESEYVVFAVTALTFGVVTSLIASKRGGIAWQWFILGVGFGIVALPLALFLPSKYLRSK
jgi:hypothetical protein